MCECLWGMRARHVRQCIKVTPPPPHTIIQQLLSTHNLCLFMHVLRASFMRSPNRTKHIVSAALPHHRNHNKLRYILHTHTHTRQHCIYTHSELPHFCCGTALRHARMLDSSEGCASRVRAFNRKRVYIKCGTRTGARAACDTYRKSRARRLPERKSQHMRVRATRELVGV